MGNFVRSIHIVEAKIGYAWVGDRGGGAVWKVGGDSGAGGGTVGAEKWSSGQREDCWDRHPAVLRRQGVAVLRSTPERHPPITFGSHPHSHEHPSSSHLLLPPPS